MDSVCLIAIHCLEILRLGRASVRTERSREYAASDNELTLLMWAAGSGQDAMVRFLLDRGADKSLKDNRGLTALAIARDAKQAVAARLLE